MPADDAALLAQIWSDPTDRQALAVYADWLATHGDATRAEFMQLRLLAKPTPAQRARAEALRKKHRGAWLGAGRPHVYTWEEDDEVPGFVRRCQCATARLTRGFAEIERLGPRLVVAVTAPKAKRETIALAKMPLGTLYGLAFHEADAQWVTDELMATLAPAMHGLRELVLDAWPARASDRGFAALLPHVTTLRHLTLSIGENRERWLPLLAEAGLDLETLSLPGWIPPAQRASLAKLARRVTYRAGERYNTYDRASGYYV